MHFSIAIGWVEQSGHGSGERDGVVGSTEFPGILQEDGNDLAGLEAGSYESAGQTFYNFAVFGVGDSAVVGRIDDCCTAGMAATAFENQVVNEAVGGVGVELSA